MTSADFSHPLDTGSWQKRPAPVRRDGRTWSLLTLTDLATSRVDIRAHIEASITPWTPAAHEGGERALLVADEMASNGIRHAGPPIRLTVCAPDRDGQYLISVVDRSPDLLPAPDRYRDPTQGGLGLQMIAAFSGEHGWWPAGDGKTVWALVPRHVEP